MIFDLQDITVGEFFGCSEEMALKYMELRKILNPVGKFGKRNAAKLSQLTYGEVSVLKRNVANPSYPSIMDSFKKVFRADTKEVLDATVTQFFPALNWIAVEMGALIKKETKALSGDTDSALKEAGVERLNAFQEGNVLIKIGKEFGKSPDEVENWEYGTVFTILLHDKVTSEIERAYAEIKKRQRK